MTDSPDRSRMTYADAGVDIAAGDALVRRIAPLVARTKRSGVLGSLGGFGGLFALPPGYREPVLVSGTDGVGTKLRLAIDVARATGTPASSAESSTSGTVRPGLDTVGIDLVAMCVNDIAVTGAEPLWFLDYFATGRLDVDRATRVIAGIARGCELAGAALLGGETAEMPDMYAGDDFDLAGFAVGIVERDALIDGATVRAGQVLIGLGSSGLHSNGFSLVRRLLERARAAGRNTPTTDELLQPTTIYVEALTALRQVVAVSALAHITGGGLIENLPRVLPAGLGVALERSNWPRVPLFDWLRAESGTDEREFLSTFNDGIGMVAFVDAERSADALACLANVGVAAWCIGEVVSADERARVRLS